MIDQTHILLSILSFFGAGILLAFTPCVLPMIPILSSILIGKEKKGTLRTFQLSLTFVLSMALTYAGAGMLAGYLGSTVQTAMQLPWVIISFSLIFVLMGMSMFGMFNIRMPYIVQNFFIAASNKQKGGSVIGVAVMGFLSTLIASPCITAPLLGVLTFIGQTGNTFFGGVMLFALALGMGLPLLLFGIGQDALLPKSGEWMNKIKFLFGVMMFGLAIWMISRLLPDAIILFLWAALLIVSAIAFGAFNFKGEKKLPPLLHGISVLAFVYGSLLLVGALSGHDNPWQPLAAFSHANNTSESNVAKIVAPSDLFTRVTKLSDLQEKLHQAKQNKKPVMVEFFATWCSVCRHVDANVLSDSLIQKRLQKFTAIRVDITDQTEDAAELVKFFHVYGTPAFFFYDSSGKVVNTESLNEGVTKDSLDEILVKLS